MIIIEKKQQQLKQKQTNKKTNNYSDIKVNICLGGVEFARPVCRHYR